MIEIQFNPKILNRYFDLKVVQACRSCKRYGLGQCPSNIPNIEYYKNLLPSYKYGLIVYERFEIAGDWKEQGRSSSLKIHDYLLKKQNQLFNLECYYSIILGGGSCKFCINCMSPCIHPNTAIVPIEGCGLDVVSLMKRFDIYLRFPVENFFLRVGMILYD
jgi:predicted metal-binding protein